MKKNIPYYLVLPVVYRAFQNAENEDKYKMIHSDVMKTAPCWRGYPNLARV